ncbi:nucleotidyltransferase domain-containing protein [Thermosulfurimonas dismutans]|uniref:Uncharacterized protein n=1 Tax=Thermosulfurimonas dismutans TaxID=999894 RepID=A0A179D1B4_9BACT|nr:nucleotidyltransferase domain-containing protein [Thermosulfurimonas dismutans]OAQ19840.1 hypothetical protein TDIS_2058 [Thermosulfurimonas dismutans]
MRYLDTQHIVENNWEKLAMNRRYEYLHFRINQLLNSIVNLNVLDRGSKVLINSIRDKSKLKVSLSSVNYLKNLLKILNRITGKNYSLSYNILYLKNYIEFFLKIHNIILNYLHEYVKTRPYLVQAKQYDNTFYAYPQLIEVRNFYKKVSRIEGLKEVFIQGSLSTLDYNKFSDFDTFIIISKEAEEDVDLFIDTIFKLFRASRYFYKFDPYQHHRYFACLESDLYAYNQACLPTKVLDYATSIKNSEELFFQVYDSRLSHVIFLTNVLNYFVIHHEESFKRIANLWNLKYFVATVLFIPVLFLEVINIYVYKRDSFSIIKQFLSIDLQNYIDRCSYLRQIWNYKLTTKENLFRKLFLDIYLNPILYEYVMQKYSQKINRKEFNYIFSGSIPYTQFFYDEVRKIYKKDFNIDVE